MKIRLLSLAFAAALAASFFGESGSAADGAPRPPQVRQIVQNSAPMQPQQMQRQAQQAGPARGLPAGAYRLQPAVILDPSGFEQPMAAATLFIPYGWKTQGGVSWGQQFMCTNGYVFDWSATSPDGSMTIAVLPQERWQSNNYGTPASTLGCQSAPYQNARQYLESLVQRRRPGARVLDYRPRPDLAKDFSQLNSTTPTAMGEIRNWVDAGELLFAFNDHGRDMRGTVAVVVAFSVSRMSSGVSGEMDARTGTSFPAYAMTAPNGQLNFALGEAIRKSIQPNPQWTARIGNHNTAIARAAIDAERKRAAIISQNYDEISRIQQDAWNAQQESADKRAEDFGDMIRGVQRYQDENQPTGQVELSNTYDNAWRLNDGSYILTDNPNFDPWQDLHVEGKRLNPVQ